MGSANSKITRKKLVAYARRSKGADDGHKSGHGEPAAADDADSPTQEATGEPTAPDGLPIQVEPTDGAPKPGDGPKSATTNSTPAAAAGEPAKPTETPAATPAPAAPTAAPDAPTGPSMFTRNKGETIAMPPNLTMGSAPAMPADAAIEPGGSARLSAVTELPDPESVPTVDPNEPAAPPGHVPQGDSRSLRHGDQFALVYRRTTHLVTRVGTVGMQGTWRVVEYPTLGAAANAYAHECSRFVGDGFVDYR